ncbi:hypothetical protein Baya_2207 [Bagarius yarrelli]|uniref:Uncharacterized protein n=1 Tax=Bagarius yarrelli TaxID=175774 RepID=A0A556TNA4_BAGYA|nr:hypothetical protein Baya_2207 [Bagarius yarrelli]
MSCVLGLMGVSVLLICMLLLAFVYGEVMELAAGIYGFEILLLYLETPVLPSISPPSPPPPTTLPQSGGLPYFPPLPAPEVRSRKPDQMKFETQLKHQTLTPIPVEGTVFEELEDERLLQGTANSIMTQRDLMTKLTKKDTTPPKSTMIPKMDMMTELKRKLLKRQVSDGAIQDISKENELSTKQEMAAKEQSTLQKVPQKDLIPELKKKDTPPPKRDAITEIKKRQLKRQVTQ